MQNQVSSLNESLVVDVSARQLLAFATLAATLSYPRAAERLHYTQQGISAQLKRLERLLGCKLLERAGRNVRLTSAGERLLPECRVALAALARMGGARRRIVIGASVSTGPYLLPPVIRALATEHPETLVDVVIAPRDELMRLVASGAAHLAVAGGLARLPVAPSLCLTYWVDEEVVLLRSRASPQSAGPTAMVFHAHSHREVDMLSEMRNRLDHAGIGAYELRALPSAEAVKGACAAGLGYGLLPRRAALLELDAGILEAAASVSGSAAVWICHPPVEEVNADTRTVLDFLLRTGSRPFLTDGMARGDPIDRSENRRLSGKQEGRLNTTADDSGGRPVDLSDTAWARVGPLLPQRDGQRGRPRRSDRIVLNAILWVRESGASWRELPQQYGPWQTAYDRFARWRREGVWDRVMKSLQSRNIAG